MHLPLTLFSFDVKTTEICRKCFCFHWVLLIELCPTFFSNRNIVLRHSSFVNGLFVESFWHFYNVFANHFKWIDPWKTCNISFYFVIHPIWKEQIITRICVSSAKKQKEKMTWLFLSRKIIMTNMLHELKYNYGRHVRYFCKAFSFGKCLFLNEFSCVTQFFGNGYFCRDFLNNN